jgi:hypothetical protein
VKITRAEERFNGVLMYLEQVQYPTVATISPVPGKQTAKMPASNSSTWRAPVRLGEIGNEDFIHILANCDM